MPTLEEKFEIFGILGEGVSGTVYDAKPRGEEKHVALKVLHPHLWGDEQIRGRFTREAAILRRLEGDHLCPMLDFGEVYDEKRKQTLLYMTLDKIDGPSLERLMTVEGPLPMERIVDIGLQIGSALEDAHKQGVIHRDLKPANVLMRGGKHAVVLDFGMAKIVAGPGGTGTTALTSHNMVFGTPEYMAPEQARGEELDGRCDIYALGIILYQLVAGKVPFTGASPLNVLTAHMTLEPEPLRERVPERGVSPALEAVVHYALMKTPEQRYGRAKEMASALERALANPDDAAAVRPERVAMEPEADPHAETIPSPLPITRSEPPRPPTVRPPPPPRPQPSMPEPSWMEGPGWMLVWVVATAVGIAVGIWLSLR